MQQVVGVEVEAAPLERRLRRALQELARRVAEELRDIDALRPGAASRAAAPADRRPPERSPKKSEKKSSKRLRVRRDAASALPRGRSRRGTRPPAFRPGVCELLKRLPDVRDAGKRAGRPSQSSLGADAMARVPNSSFYPSLPKGNIARALRTPLDGPRLCWSICTALTACPAILAQPRAVRPCRERRRPRRPMRHGPCRWCQ